MASSFFWVARKCFILPAHVNETTHVRLYACHRANRQHTCMAGVSNTRHEYDEGRGEEGPTAWFQARNPRVASGDGARDPDSRVSCAFSNDKEAVSGHVGHEVPAGQ